MMAFIRPIATSVAALSLVAAAAPAPSAPPPPPPWHDGIEHEAVAAVSAATIAEAPLFRRVRAVAFERGGGGADLRAVCGEVALPGTRQEHVRFVVLYRRDGHGAARVGEPMVEEWPADEPLDPPRLLPAMWRSFCSDAAPPQSPPVLAALDDP